MLIDTANAPIFGIDADGLVNEWNRKAVAITGFSKEEVMGRSLTKDFITSEFQDSVQEVLQKALKGLQTDNYEFPLFTKEGKRVEVLLNATTRRDTSGKTLGVVGVGQDITELKAANSELQRVANDLTLLIDTANAPIFGIDANGLVNEWNRKMAAITGYRKEDVLGRDLVAGFISDEFKSSVKEVLQNALRGLPVALDSSRTSLDGSRRGLRTPDLMRVASCLQAVKPGTLRKLNLSHYMAGESFRVGNGANCVGQYGESRRC